MSTTHPDDNIASADNTDLDEYIKAFEKVSERGDTMRQLWSTLPSQTKQDARLALALQYITQQQKYNDEVYDLIVALHNLHAPRSDS